ncbi:CaiB/BaiF CoA transferase family protein [Natrialba asiatica]|uniref:Bile acid-inducible L-carnitine dehydratase protein F n=1 Tax=Natrialba asiatica (strain ATCC 700177 / DSM 12278 / JCM 9576 / FERM P-10747 / NBRC 102637 / 172P1) TaxID=29540 RepID=M0AY53_NATA1|nr:CoA transferase [Natrialba asiatica]ELZ03430.1 bile acid-inducible L-carnitine dehydratase protein F [Natrialba asiatica DSM 12278]
MTSDPLSTPAGTPTENAPLEGVRVLDCTQMLSGPFATQLLADMGADVVKIERPDRGDITRSVGPEIGDSGLTAYFTSLNRGKRSVELNLASEEGAAALERLAETADVLVENYRPGTMAKWGLDYDDLREVTDELVYCSISGFLEGPYRDMPAFDMVVQALGGSMSITGQADGPPARPGIPIGDICAGMYAVIGITTALYNDESQYIDVPMFEGLVSWLTERAGRTFVTEEPYPRRGTVHPSLAPYRTVETADGWFAVAIGSDDTWTAFCEAIDRPELATDDRYAANNDRVEHRESLTAALEPIFEQRTNDEWFELFRERGLPGAPVQDTVEVFEDEHLRASGTLDELTIDGVDLPFPTCPIEFTGKTTRSGHEPPRLGEHTEPVLSAVLSDEALASVLGR